jgi:hypothetical protein
MPLRERPWWPWASAALWGLLVLVLLLVNTGNVVLAVAGGAVVAELSRRLAKAGAPAQDEG